MTLSFPYRFHPCWTNERSNLWERIHLPVATKCNVQCNFCTNQTSSCFSIGPGTCKKSMTPEDAMNALHHEMKKSDNLRIVAISGPGEPLYNKETFATLENVRKFYPDMKFCLSTNGILLGKSVEYLVGLEVATVSVSMSAILPNTVNKIYSWGIIEGNRIDDDRIGNLIPKLQLEGIEAASDAGIDIKVNTILIPDLNDDEILDLSMKIKQAGASLQNIVPLFPRGLMRNMGSPSFLKLNKLREAARRYIPQFTHCKQCRSDVVGIPGCDRVLSQ
ncbi:MAG: radical SAM protein [Candidatus Thorarchaeota archaeon]